VNVIKVPHIVKNMTAHKKKQNNKSQGKSISQSSKCTKLECGPMPNVMVALPNIGGTLCSTPQSLADAHCWNTVQ